MLALLAILGAAATASAASNCDAPYLCKYHYQTSKHLWIYDFTPSCDEGSEFEYQVPLRNDNMMYHFQLCGTTIKQCGTGTKFFAKGTMVQTFDTGNGGGESCEVLGTGNPIYSPWDAASLDQPPIGINVTFNGPPPNLQQPDLCPEDRGKDMYPGRSGVFRLTCDPTINGLKVDTVDESPTCFYNVYGRSKYACASRYRGPDASAADTGDPNQYIGLNAGTAFACIFGGIALSFAVWFGVSYIRTRTVPFCGGAGGAASTSFTGGSSAGAAPSFGGSTGVGAGGGYGQVA